MNIFRIAMLSLPALATMAAAGEDVFPEYDWSRIYLGASPCVSPDGDWFAFEWCDRIWRAPVDGGTAVPLTSGEAEDCVPVVSPDGRRVAFLSDRAGGWRLFQMDVSPDGSRAGNLRQASWHSEGLTPCAYSPDGKYIVATAVRDFSTGVCNNQRESSRALLVPADERGAEELLFNAPAVQAALSPDGGKVLFVYGHDSCMQDTRKRIRGSKSSCNCDIWMYDRKSRKFTALADSIDDESHPLWDPDGKGFYYLRETGGVRNVHHRSLADCKDRQLTFFKQDHVFYPTLSRDGRTMVFRCGFDFWRMDPTAARPLPERILLHPAGAAPSMWKTRRRKYTCMDNDYGEGNCTFRANGDETAFTAGGDVWVMDSGKRKPVLVHGSSRTHERDCRFSPDGESLYYLSDRGEGADVWVARRSDTNAPWAGNQFFELRRLTSDDTCKRNLTVSPDGKSLAWTDLCGRLVFAGTNGAVKCVSRAPASECLDYAWSPDGKYVAASLCDGFWNFDVWIVPAWDKDEAGNPAPAPYNVSRNHKWDCNVAWSPDGRILAFCGERTAAGGEFRLLYVYLAPVDEDRETAGKGAAKGKPRIVFEGLAERVRDTGVKGWQPFFSHDGRTLGYSVDGKTRKIKLPDRLKPESLLQNECRGQAWVKIRNDDRILRTVDKLPALGDRKLDFTVYKTIDVPDYQELAFRSAWASMRDGFCDPAMHGVDWNAVLRKYSDAARNAPHWTIFRRIVVFMNGELDASHTGFWAGSGTKARWTPSINRQEWTETTANLGVRFDPAHRGEGWRVSYVIPRSPADRGAEGLLPGDTVLSADGVPLAPGMDVAEALNTHLPHKFKLLVKRDGEKEPFVREIDAIDFAKARTLLRAEGVRRARAQVRAAGNFGYLAIDNMDTKSANVFADEVFAECFGKDGVIIDVRFNTGGFTADKLIDMLCGNRHARCLYRGAEQEGYIISRYGRPVVTHLPVVALANQHSMSNAEEFSHAMKTLRRAKLVGVRTAGEVIGTNDNPLFDYGVLRRPRIGFFTPDGTDMEWHGAKPDVEVEITPADLAAGRDPQLAAAIETLKAETAAAKANLPPPLKYVK